MAAATGVYYRTTLQHVVSIKQTKGDYWALMQIKGHYSLISPDQLKNNPF